MISFYSAIVIFLTVASMKFGLLGLIPLATLFLLVGYFEYKFYFGTPKANVDDDAVYEVSKEDQDAWEVKFRKLAEVARDYSNYVFENDGRVENVYASGPEQIVQHFPKAINIREVEEFHDLSEEV